MLKFESLIVLTPSHQGVWAPTDKSRTEKQQFIAGWTCECRSRCRSEIQKWYPPGTHLFNPTYRYKRYQQAIVLQYITIPGFWDLKWKVRSQVSSLTSGESCLSQFWQVENLVDLKSVKSILVDPRFQEGFGPESGIQRWIQAPRFQDILDLGSSRPPWIQDFWAKTLLK